MQTNLAQRKDASPPSLDILAIDDEELFSEGLRQTLEMAGYRAEVANNGVTGLRLVAERRPSIVLVDLKMPGMNGIDVLSRLSEIAPQILAIVITGHGTIDSAIESMKHGAFDFIMKPFEPEKLLEVIRRGMIARQETPVVAPPANDVAMPDKQDVLLAGLAVLGDGYALGLGKRDLFDELSKLEGEATYHETSLGKIRQREKTILDLRDDLKQTDTILASHGFRKNALIQVLLDVQQRTHWLPRHVLRWISARLGVPMSEILTIATFYEAFSLVPCGKHRVNVCTGTACHVRGASELLTRASSVLGLEPGETDANLNFTLETVNCMGCCALAPVVEINGEHYQNPNLKRFERIVESLREGVVK